MGRIPNLDTRFEQEIDANKKWMQPCADKGTHMQRSIRRSLLRAPAARYLGCPLSFLHTLHDFRVFAGSRTLGFRVPAARYLGCLPLAT